MAAISYLVLFVCHKMLKLRFYTRADAFQRILKDFGRDYVFAQTTPSFHARRPIARLDRIIVDPSLEIAACGTHHSRTAASASDHLPVWARLKPAN